MLECRLCGLAATTVIITINYQLWLDTRLWCSYITQSYCINALTLLFNPISKLLGFKLSLFVNIIEGLITFIIYNCNKKKLYNLLSIKFNNSCLMRAKLLHYFMWFFCFGLDVELVWQNQIYWAESSGCFLEFKALFLLSTHVTQKCSALLVFFYFI